MATLLTMRATCRRWRDVIDRWARADDLAGPGWSHLSVWVGVRSGESLDLMTTSCATRRRLCQSKSLQSRLLYLHRCNDKPDAHQAPRCVTAQALERYTVSRTSNIFSSQSSSHLAQLQNGAH